MGKRIIYVATQSLGFEVDGYPQVLTSRALVGGIFNCKEKVEYIAITSVNGDVIIPTKSIRLFDRFYIFNPVTLTIDEEDIVDKGIDVIQATTSDVIRFERNSYVRKNTFDCSKENDQQNSAYQPIQGLINDSSYLTIKTHNFCDLKDKPQHEDLLFYQGRFWMVEDTRETFIYTPREKAVLHISLKQIKK